MTIEQTKEIEEIVNLFKEVQIRTMLFATKQANEFKELSDEEKEETLKEIRDRANNDKDVLDQLKQLQLGLYAAVISGL